MTKQLPVKEKDIIEVLPGCPFPGLVYSEGIVRESLSFMFCVVEFPADKRSTEGSPADQRPSGKDGALAEIFQGRYWCIPWKYLRVVESSYDDHVGTLEEEILGLEADLVTARSCLIVSEEMREHQFNLIEKLVQEVDMLKAEVYHLRNLNAK